MERKRAVESLTEMQAMEPQLTGVKFAWFEPFVGGSGVAAIMLEDLHGNHLEIRGSRLAGRVAIIKSETIPVPEATPDA